MAEPFVTSDHVTRPPNLLAHARCFDDDKRPCLIRASPLKIKQRRKKRLWKRTCSLRNLGKSIFGPHRHRTWKQICRQICKLPACCCSHASTAGVSLSSPPKTGCSFSRYVTWWTIETIVWFVIFQIKAEQEVVKNRIREMAWLMHLSAHA